jgi:propionate CoA-transferase
LNKVSEAATTLSRVKDDSVVAISGFNLSNTPEYLILELYNLYLKTGHPRFLFVVSDALPATPGRALDAVAAKIMAESNQSFIRGVMLPYLGFAPSLQDLIMNNRIEAYSWPIGISAYWFREVASGRPGLVTKIGIDTVLDPRREGGALNELGRVRRTCRVSLLSIDEEEYLFYRAPKPDFALVRATTADASGNLSMEDESIRGTVLSIAQAAKAHPKPGAVFAQVRWVTGLGAMNPRNVDVPAPLVDGIVVSPRQYHWQSGSFEYDPRLSYKVLPALTTAAIEEIVPVAKEAYHKVIVRRVLLELVKILEEKGAPALVNIGVGIPALLSREAAEEDISEYIVTVLESGQWGGIALPGVDFGTALSPFALSTMPDMFTNFEGGIIDAASLGFLEVDAKGNVNPSVLPGRIFGPGGFPVIAGGSPRIYFAGAFTAGQAKIETSPNGLRIMKDGNTVKFVQEVGNVFFSGGQGVKYGKEILYVTERAVFRLAREGLLLEEIAPGVDLDKDILKRMKFAPSIAGNLRTMEKEIFSENAMGVKERISNALR